MFVLKRLLEQPCYYVLGSRKISSSVILYKTMPKNLKGRSKSSQEWLTRQLNDPYVKRAHKFRYRARSAFKILEIDDRHKIFKPGQVVVECGAAPGAWTQVIIPRINSLPDDTNKRRGIVIGIDINSIYPMPGAIFLDRLDFTTEAAHQKTSDTLAGKMVDVVLSDMAPNASGTKDLDRSRILILCNSALKFAIRHCSRGGTFLCKMWAGNEVQEFQNNLQQYYDDVKIVKPPCSRKDSSEVFLLGKKFKGVT